MLTDKKYFWLVIFTGLVIQLIVGYFVVENFIFIDTHPEVSEVVVYLMVLFPTFALPLILLCKTSFKRSAAVAIILYGFGLIVISLFDDIALLFEKPTFTTVLGNGQSFKVAVRSSYDFYVTGGGSLTWHWILPGIVIHFFVTLITLAVLKKLLNKEHHPKV